MKFNNKIFNKLINESIKQTLNEITFGGQQQQPQQLSPNDKLNQEVKDLFQIIDKKVKILNNIANSTDDYRITRSARFIVDSLLRTADIIDHKLHGARGLRY